MPEETRLTDGQLEFADGVDASVVKTKAVPSLPNGIKGSQLAWLINGTVRGGGISQRPTFQRLVHGQKWSGLYQGGMMYQPDGADPFLLLAIGGALYQVRVDTDNSVRNLSLHFGPSMPATVDQAFFRQAEMFAVWQAGDFTTKPIFYDFGVDTLRAETMVRSRGFLGIGNALNQIPPAGPMDDYGQRLWYAIGRQYIAGDIVLNQTSGSATYGYRDSVLAVTENPVATSGDAFVVPTNAGAIRALAHASNIDTALGESQLFVFTRRAVYACVAPITRNDWTAANRNLMPLQKVALNGGGTYGERSVVPVNGDLFFAGPPNGDIRSMQAAVRNYGQWGSVPLSNNENRVLQVNDRSKMRFASGIQFQNRLLETALPLTTPVGVAFQAIIPLDFDVISTLQERRPPAWEGVWDVSGGPYVLQLFEGDFSGRDRAFAVCYSVKTGQIEVWELREDLKFDNGDNRVTKVVEFPAYPFKDPFQMKELETGELWLDRVTGTVDITVEYRPDSYACYIPWCTIRVCSPQDCRENENSPCIDNGYPQTPYCETDVAMKSFPKIINPQRIPGQERPSNWGYQFQVRLTIKGFCRIRGLLLHAIPRFKRPFESLAQPTFTATRL